MSDNPADADGAFNARLGARLREQRLRRGLTLQDVERLTDGSMKYTVLGSYERGERTPGIRRIMQLADVYQVPVEQLLHSADELSRRAMELRRFELERGKAVFDLDNLQQAPEEARTLNRFVGGLQGMRDDYGAEVFTVRTGDVTIMSAIYGVSLPELWQRMSDWGVLAYGQ